MLTDPGFPIGGHGPWGCELLRSLHFENFVDLCQNERIWTLRGACTRHTPSKSANDDGRDRVIAYTSRSLMKSEKKYLSLADLEGVCPTHAPLRVQILSFQHTKYLKCNCLGSPHPPLYEVHAHPYRKSWICHCLSSKFEFLVLKWAIADRFHEYLYGGMFKVHLHDNPLPYVLTMAKLDVTGQRWVASLANYNFTLKY